MTLDELSVIRPVGTRQWEDIGWDGQGNHSLVNTELGSICPFMYLGMVSVHC
jgi:hypothetical protein